MKRKLLAGFLLGFGAAAIVLLIAATGALEPVDEGEGLRTGVMLTPRRP